MDKTYQGLSVSEGVAIAQVLLLNEHKLDFPHEKIKPEMAGKHLEKFAQAVAATKIQITAQHAETVSRLGEENAEILEAHLEVLEDPSLAETIAEKITDQLLNAEWAIEAGIADIVNVFEALDNEYMRERAADIQDVGRRILENALGVQRVDRSCLPYPCILVARDLTPSETMALDFSKTMGFITEKGGKTSHTAIVSRNLGLPAIVGVPDLFDELTGDELLVLDAMTGRIAVNPSEEELAHYREKQLAYHQRKEKLAELKNLPAVTTDGHEIELCANIGSVSDAELAAEHGAEGVGLYRTEFLYMNNTNFPTEEQQMVAYRAAADALHGKPVIVRTLDIGGDKDLPYYAFEKEENPFMGWRAIRICLDMPHHFKTQLRGILRASAHARFRIMFPMIISLEELLQAKSILDECKAELRAEGIAFDEAIETGIMVETPASVILADVLAEHVDFFSIGTNDLCQYTLAVDRGNAKIASRYNFLHPAVLRSIKRVIDAAHAAGKWIGMCGEFASEEIAARLLVGFGLDEFSMTPPSIPKIKEIIRQTNYADAVQLAGKVLKAPTIEAVERLLNA